MSIVIVSCLYLFFSCDVGHTDDSVCKNSQSGMHHIVF